MEEGGAKKRSRISKDRVFTTDTFSAYYTKNEQITLGLGKKIDASLWDERPKFKPDQRYSIFFSLC